MKRFPSPLAASFFCLVLMSLSGCTTIENRRDLYFPQRVEGPYTRMLQHGLKAPAPAQTVQATENTLPLGSGKNVIKPQG